MEEMKTSYPIIVAIFSDTHGEIEKMRKTVREIKPDCIIHLGDCVWDVRGLGKEFPNTSVCAVAGNCDYGSQEPEEGVLTIGEIRIFVTHGHHYEVRENVDGLVRAAIEQKCQIALYGHTHIPDCREIQGVRIVNPGSAGIERELSISPRISMPTKPSFGRGCAARVFRSTSKPWI